MAMNNHPDRIVLDAFSDPQLEAQNPNGVYSRFTNRLTTPILNAKGVLLMNANFVNPILQLNDASQLVFWYYRSATRANIRGSANLRCVRLHPSTFVPYPGYTNFVKNKYFNSGTELAAALTAASAATGDSITYNPNFVANELSFSYDTTTRKMSVTCLTAATYIAPAAADDPLVLACLQTISPFTPAASYQIKMNGYNSANSNATATPQPFVLGISMNARLGFAMSYLARGLWWGSSSQVGCATSTGVPQLTSTAIEADANPIMIGSQNVNVYTSITTGGGMDSLNRKNLLATIPLEVAALNVNSYTMSSIEKPSLSTPNEIYEITVEFRDDYGIPVPFPPNYNAELQLAIFY